MPLTLPIVWACVVCMLAGAIAAGTGMPSLWGSGNVFMEYAAPLPFGWGLMHWPGLLAFGGMLAAAGRHPGRWVRATQFCAIGTTAGVVVAYTAVQPIRDLPLLMYLAIDAPTALLAVSLVPVREPSPWSIRQRNVMLAAPAALVVAALVATPLLRDRYRIPMTDTIETGYGEELRVWVILQGAAERPEDECEGLKAIADQYRSRFTQRGSNTPMNGTVLLFRDVERVSRDSAGAAWIRYSWTHGSPDRCGL